MSSLTDGTLTCPLAWVLSPSTATVMGMMRKILNPITSIKLSDRFQVSSTKKASVTPARDDEAVRRIRQDYLRSLGIQKTKAQPTTLRPSSLPEARARPQRSPSQEEEAPSTAAEVPGGSFELADEETPPVSADVHSGCSSVELAGKDDFRVNFLRKLSYSKVWVPAAQRPPKSQTVIIFDWDDTLLCTSFLNLAHEKGKGFTAPVAQIMREIALASRRLLEAASRFGQTFIITNAMNGWVEYSSAKWVPELLPVLQKVRVISARTKYEPQYPGEVSKWKIQAFLEVQRQLNSEIITNLISLGDSNFEMDAVHVMGKEFAQALVKTIKFRENPSPEELLKQLELVSQKFERIVENARNLKIGLERKWVGGAQQT
mmetsp:Transcript_47045/g.150219  ORF Transcript_47045/g.150219 Transcript_47045/m.150219 type:complete len:374 (+) Transcript_47045:49-1170(+)